MADNSMYDKYAQGFPLTTSYSTPTYSTAGNLTDRGYPDSKSGVGAAGATGYKVDVSRNNGGTKTPTGTGTGYGAGQGLVSGAAEAAGFDLAAYLEQVKREQQAAADAAYERAAAALNQAYGEAKNSFGEVYNSGVGQLGNSYNNSQGKINRNAEEAFRQAYVNRMLAEKSLSQRLAAQGVSGGASESAMVNLLNNYGNSRNSIQDTLSNNLSDLETKYQGNLSDLYSAYQSQLASLASARASQLSNLEMQRANAKVAQIGDYMSMLMSNADRLNNASKAAVAAQAAYSAPASARATNAYTPVSTTQVNDMGGTLTNYSKWLDYINEQRAAGATDQGIIARLIANGLTDEEIHNYMYA